MKKFIAEFIGTGVLVAMGCGSAMIMGTNTRIGYLIVALAFGLSIVAMAYSIGNVSGCHINPAVSLAVFINGGIKFKEFILYIVAQFLGGIAGAAALKYIWHVGHLKDYTGFSGFGANGLAGVHGSRLAGLSIEVGLTFIFVIAILGVTSKKFNFGQIAGVVIGLSLTLVHIFGIRFTGTSVNPARSVGPALMAAIGGNMKPLGSLWIFIVAPLVGAAIAAFVYKFIEKE